MAWADLSLLLVFSCPTPLSSTCSPPPLFLSCVEFSSNGYHQEQVCLELLSEFPLCELG